MTLHPKIIRFITTGIEQEFHSDVEQSPLHMYIDSAEINLIMHLL